MRRPHPGSAAPGVPERGYQRARGLLGKPGMEPQPGDIVRAIRKGLGMSQTEFARAIGWAPSTISRWESGKGQPSRLDLKIVLAFGEERGVRYRPRQDSADGSNLPALCPPAPARPVVELIPLDQPTGERPAGMGRSDGAFRADPALRQPSVSRSSGAPDRWDAELSVRLSVARGHQRGAGSSGRRASYAAIVGASACALLALGSPLGWQSPAPPFRVAAVAASVPRTPSARHRDRAPTHAAAPADVPVVVAASSPPAAPRLATLEGVTLLGANRRATFRSGGRTFSLAEGDELGGRRATRIGSDGVDLVDVSGKPQTVRLGWQVPLD